MSVACSPKKILKSINALHLIVNYHTEIKRKKETQTKSKELRF